MKQALLLEDEPVLLELLGSVLKKKYSVIEATSAEQALRLFTASDRHLDLLVADLTLPTSSGIQLALLLRTEIPELPVILTSGYPVASWSSRDYADLQRLGSRSVTILHKPFQTKELSNVVLELLALPAAVTARTA
jgi:CheY-like chemotaxis protein